MFASFFWLLLKCSIDGSAPFLFSASTVRSLLVLYHQDAMDCYCIAQISPAAADVYIENCMNQKQSISGLFGLTAAHFLDITFWSLLRFFLSKYPFGSDSKDGVFGDSSLMLTSCSPGETVLVS